MLHFPSFENECWSSHLPHLLVLRGRLGVEHVEAVMFTIPTLSATFMMAAIVKIKKREDDTKSAFDYE